MALFFDVPDCIWLAEANRHVIEPVLFELHVHKAVLVSLRCCAVGHWPVAGVD